MRRIVGALKGHAVSVAIVASAFLVAAAFLVVFIPLTDVPRFAQIDFSDESRIIAEVADTAEKRELGLSGRASMQESDGMLFLFDRRGIYTFWMRGMKIPLDFIWLRDDVIIDLDENVAVDTELPLKLYAPDEPVDRMLEVNAGFAARHGLSVGDALRIELSD